MAAIPHGDKVAAEMYEAATRERERQKRKYLGMSGIGKPCARELWFDFRGFPQVPIEGRILMLFRLGDRIEDEVVHFLKQAGYEVEGQQEAFYDHGGMFRGHSDGTIGGVTQKKHILEVKSANDNKFKAIKKAGVRKVYPVYYSQVQCYMGYAGLDRALWVVQNKNTSEIYTERAYFIRSDFDALRNRAYQIITSNDPPERQFNEESQTCQWCNQRLTCWHMETTPLADQTCGNCWYFSFKGLTKICRHPDHPVELFQWGIKCPEWTSMFEARNGEPDRVGMEDVLI